MVVQSRNGKSQGCKVSLNDCSRCHCFVKIIVKILCWLHITNISEEIRFHDSGWIDESHQRVCLLHRGQHHLMVVQSRNGQSQGCEVSQNDSCRCRCFVKILVKIPCWLHITNISEVIRFHDSGWIDESHLCVCLLHKGRHHLVVVQSRIGKSQGC